MSLSDRLVRLRIEVFGCLGSIGRLAPMEGSG